MRERGPPSPSNVRCTPVLLLLLSSCMAADSSLVFAPVCDAPRIIVDIWNDPL